MSSFRKEFNIKFLKKVIDKRYYDQPELRKIKKKIFLRQLDQIYMESSEKETSGRYLSEREQIRWSRQLQNPLINQNKIKKTKVSVFGLGGIGSNVLMNLVYSGVNNLVLVDHDKVELSNLNRQTLYTPKEIGDLKTKCAKERLLEINSEIKIETHNLEIEYPKELELLKINDADYSKRIAYIDSIISKSDIVVNAMDYKGAPYLINDLCVKNQKPFYWGGINFFLGEIYNFSYLKRTPCLRDIFSSEDFLEEQSFLRYKEPKQNRKKGYDLGTIAITTGSLISNLILLDINDIDHHSYGKYIIYDNYNFEIKKIPICNIQTCPCKKYMGKNNK